jgi:hypothetical protein
MNLTPDKVTTLFMGCLSETGTEVEGITATFCLDVDGKEDEIMALLNELPKPFFETAGGGWSFLNACNDRNDDLWTGLHTVIEQLVCLGIAAGKISWLLPRNLWAALPGGMPYFVIKA